MYLISLKSFCTGRATLKERKRQPSEWENKHLQLKLETRNSSPKTQSAHTVKVKLTQLCPTLCDPWTVQPMHFSRPEYWSEPPFSSPGDLPNPGIETRSPALQVDFYQLSHQRSPRIKVIYPFSSVSSWPRNQTGVTYIAGRFFTSWATREINQNPKAYF